MSSPFLICIFHLCVLKRIGDANEKHISQIAMCVKSISTNLM